MPDKLTKKQISELKGHLLQLEKELMNLLDISADFAGTIVLDQTKVGRLSRMDAMQQQAMAQANRAAYQDRLKAVRTALQYIHSEDYGFCEECGEAIGFARLQVRPESNVCVLCQSRLE